MKVGRTDSFYESIVRTCSVGRCYERNDFVNCTADQLENPGCTRRLCCRDKDLCNQAPQSTSIAMLLICCSILLIVIIFCL